MVCEELAELRLRQFGKSLFCIWDNFAIDQSGNIGPLQFDEELAFGVRCDAVFIKGECETVFRDDEFAVGFRGQGIYSHFRAFEPLLADVCENEMVEKFLFGEARVEDVF